MNIFFQLLFGWLYGHLFEYLVHRYVLHNYKNFKPAFKNHFKTHHAISRKHKMYDNVYENIFSSKFEVYGLVFISIIHFPLVYYLPYSYLMLCIAAGMYYFMHKKSHTDVIWGKKWMPWHYEHHMGKNQNLNWGVRLPIFDYVFGTRSDESHAN